MSLTIGEIAALSRLLADHEPDVVVGTGSREWPGAGKTILPLAVDWAFDLVRIATRPKPVTLIVGDARGADAAMAKLIRPGWFRPGRSAARSALMMVGSIVRPVTRSTRITGVRWRVIGVTSGWWIRQ